MLTTPCPTCRHPLEMSTPINNAPDTKPRPGDLSICINCGQVLQYNAIMSVEPIEISSIDLSVGNGAECVEVLTKAQKLIRQRGPIKKKTQGP